MKDLLLGIDIGTTGTKCTFYSLDGSVAASAYREYPMLRPHPGWAEQDPALWWEAVCGNLRRCFDSGKCVTYHRARKMIQKGMEVDKDEK